MGIMAVAALAKTCYLTESFTRGNNKLSNTTIKSGGRLQLKDKYNQQKFTCLLIFV
jgi:hypothetical protein